MKKLGLLFLFVATTIIYGKNIIIDLENQKGYAIEKGEVVFSGRISSGTKGRETPVGNFKITEKKRYHKSTSWPKPNGGARMPYMMRLSGMPIAMHLGLLPGYPASHGCIRLEQGFAQQMYLWAKIGTPVKVKGRYTGFYKKNQGYLKENYKRKEMLPKKRIFGSIIDKNYYGDASTDIISPEDW